MFSVFCTVAAAQWYSPPAGTRSARIGTAVSILPGGRITAPLGEQYVTGWEPVALALSASGKVLVTVNRDPQATLTVMEHEKRWETRQLPLESSNQREAPPTVSGGLAFSSEHSVYISEGITGRISLIDLEAGERRRSIDIGAGRVAGDLAFDWGRNNLYVADVAHPGVIVVDARSRQILGSAAISGTPVAMALAPDHEKLYVATGSRVYLLDVAEPRAPRVDALIRADGWNDGDLAGIAVTPDRVFVSDKEHDSIAVINSGTNKLEREVAIRIEGLETLRGVHPAGMAFDEQTGWLLVAEAGLNAVGIIDTHSWKVLGHLPVGWVPTQIAASHGLIYVANARGQGSGPSTRGNPGARGSVSMFALPEAGALSAQTRFVMEADGLTVRPVPPSPLPKAVRHVVLIVKNGGSFDDVFGDMAHAANGTVMGAPQLARFGQDGYVTGQRQRLSLHHLNVTPNHHAIATRWTLGDNFYADSGAGREGIPWAPVSRHLEQHGVSFTRLGEGLDANMPDSERARRMMAEVDERFAKRGDDLPGLLLIELAGDRMEAARPDAGYPYEESHLADNDLALGRIVEYLSGSKWWGEMVVFVTETSVKHGIDHIDAHRTILLCAGPWVRKNSVSHENASFPGLLKTIFRLLGVPPVALSDATAADLSDCFTNSPDLQRYRAVEEDPRLYRP